MENNAESIKDKKYNWPKTEMAHGSGDATNSSILIALSIKILGEILHDLAKQVEKNNDLLQSKP